MHKTHKIALKTIDVDANIIPVVNWLNSVIDTTTQFSCEGEPKGKKKRSDYYDYPYIIFNCNSFEALYEISKVIDYFHGHIGILDAITIEPKYWQYAAHLRFQMKFKDKKYLIKFNNYLK